MEQHISRIEASKEFRGSEQLRRLLRYLARVSARGEVATQYGIATDVFGRPSWFDSGADPIVRVEMRRLRKHLAEYYRNHPDDPARLQVPERSYTVVVSDARAEAFRAPRVAVLPFRPVDDDGTCAPYSEALADDLIYYLRPDPAVAVLARTSVFSLAARGMSAAEIAGLIAADWVVEGSVSQAAGTFRIRAALLRAPGMQQDWDEVWSCPASSIPGIADVIGAAVRCHVVPRHRASE